MLGKRVFTTLATVLTAVLLLSCGVNNAIKQAAERTRRSNDLKQIGLAFLNYNDMNDKGPAKVEDLIPLLVGATGPIQDLQNGTIVFIYGVSVKDMTKQAGSFNTVLAYESKVPVEGGLVLMGDCSVRTVTAVEFKGMNLATPARDEKKEEKPKTDTKKPELPKKDTKK